MTYNNNTIHITLLIKIMLLFRTYIVVTDTTHEIRYVIITLILL